jgi:hypothetical protein
MAGESASAASRKYHENISVWRWRAGGVIKRRNGALLGSGRHHRK